MNKRLLEIRARKMEIRKALEGDGKVDLFIPGCPPHPYTSLDGLLRFIGKIEG